MAFPVSKTPVVMLGAVCWALSVLSFPAQAVVQAASARPYSLATNLISDLGNTACGPTVCSPLHGLMNAATHVAAARMGLASLNAGMLVLGLLTLPLARRGGDRGGDCGRRGRAAVVELRAGLPPGITERVADYPGAAMIVVLGALLVGRIVRARRTLVSPSS